MHNLIKIALHALFHTCLEKVRDFAFREKLVLDVLYVLPEMTQYMNFFIFILCMERSYNILHLMFTQFKIKSFLFQVPVVQHENQMVSYSDFVILRVSLFEDIAHDGDKHV